MKEPPDREWGGGEVGEGLWTLTCLMGQLCPTFWQRLEIHKSEKSCKTVYF